jgi:hypothetical protein
LNDSRNQRLFNLRHEVRRTDRPADQLAPSQPNEGGGGFALEQVSIFSLPRKHSSDKLSPIRSGIGLGLSLDNFMTRLT